MDNDTIKALSEAVKNVTEIAKEPIRNLTDKPTKAIGAGFSDIFELIFAGPKTLNTYVQHKISQFKQELEKGIENIPNDKRVDPPLNIVGPALEAARFYISEDEIRSLFTNLIVCSMCEDKCDAVHPAFVEIIKQLNPMDARILALLHKNRKSYPIANIINTKLPITSPDTSGHVVFIHNFIPLEMVNIKNFKTVEASIDNLIRLNIINVNYISTISDKSIYDSIKNHIVYKGLVKATLNEFLVGYQEGIWSFTTFGDNFAKVCI